MKKNKKTFQHFEECLPVLASGRDLVNAGIFRSLAALTMARKRGNAPDYIKMSDARYLYPKEAVLEFLNTRFTNSNRSGDTYE